DESNYGISNSSPDTQAVGAESLAIFSLHLHDLTISCFRRCPFFLLGFCIELTRCKFFVEYLWSLPGRFLHALIIYDGFLNIPKCYMKTENMSSVSEILSHLKEGETSGKLSANRKA